MKLNELVILLEDRIDHLKTTHREKLSGILGRDQTTTNNPDEFIDKIVAIDPSRKKIYTQWLLLNYIKGNVKAEDIYKSVEDLKKFEKYKSKLDKKDINQYKNPKELTKVVADLQGEEEPVSNKQAAKQIKSEGADTVAKGPDATIKLIKTKEAACFYGKGTRWCTAASKGNNMFDHYNKQGNIYIVFGSDGRKYQLHFESEQYMDEDDDSVDVTELMDTYPTVKNWIMPKVNKQYSTGQKDSYYTVQAAMYAEYSDDQLDWPNYQNHPEPFYDYLEPENKKIADDLFSVKNMVAQINGNLDYAEHWLYQVMVLHPNADKEILHYLDKDEDMLKAFKGAKEFH